MSVKILSTCDGNKGSFGSSPSSSSKRHFGMLNAGSSPRTRQGLKLSFNRSISEPQGIAHLHHHPNKRFCAQLIPPSPEGREEEEENMRDVKRVCSEVVQNSTGGNNNTLAPPPGNDNVHPVSSRSLPCSPSVADSPLQRSLLLSKVKSVDPASLALRISSTSPPLIVDCRSFIAYNVNHIRSSFNVNVCDRFNRKRLQHGKASLGDLAASKAGKEILKRRNWKEVIVYDDCTENAENLPSGHTLLIVLNALVEDDREPVILTGGFRAFELSHRSFCENHLMEDNFSSSSLCRDLPSPAKDIENHPATKVLPHMYLGNMRDASDIHGLQRLGVGYVLNVTSKPPGYTMDPNIRYKQLRASDNGLQNLHQFFEEAFEFIDLAKRNRSGVLIHCQAGVSRSPTIAVAYLMKYYPMAMAEAYKYVKTKRSIISPNLNFMGQLWEFEKGLLQNNNNDSPLRRTASFANSLSSSELSLEEGETSNPNGDFNSNTTIINHEGNGNLINGA